MKKQIKMPKYGKCFAMGLREPSGQEQLLCWSRHPKLKLVMQRDSILVVCWGPSAYEGPQKQDLTVFLEYNV
jgi:hypothetical protein